ncbi:MAG: tRNA (guanine(46)-N(7))-methyltransferase TrmB, partial [Candidatus Wenzhouxiangella sp. M2_3B_020]
RQPLHPASRPAFETLARTRSDRPLILDSGCGTGASTAVLADRFPDHLVVGIDRSAARLARAPSSLPANAMLLRARVEDIWRLLYEHGIRPARHYLLYPNPWPKSAHVRRRWHGHSVFPVFLALSRRLEVRVNWRLYVDEFRVASGVCGIETPPVVSFQSDAPLTPFERKYRASAHELFRLTIDLENPQ